MFFHYRQNNSGGAFQRDDRLDVNVFIEADDGVAANKIAESVGIYFDGIEDGRDCPCCGSRWDMAGEGTEQPLIWGDPITPEEMADKGSGIIIYCADGRVVRSGEEAKDATAQ